LVFKKSRGAGAKKLQQKNKKTNFKKKKKKKKKNPVAATNTKKANCMRQLINTSHYWDLGIIPVMQCST
jgi:hypothetical protein